MKGMEGERYEKVIRTNTRCETSSMQIIFHDVEHFCCLFRLSPFAILCSGGQKKKKKGGRQTFGQEISVLSVLSYAPFSPLFYIVFFPLKILYHRNIWMHEFSSRGIIHFYHLFPNAMTCVRLLHVPVNMFAYVHSFFLHSVL